MRSLENLGLDEALRVRVRLDRPTLGICLGLQLALELSEEDGGVPGLAIVPGRAVRLREGRVPRIGWAPVDPLGDAFYFAHSYAAETPAATATSESVVAEARSGSFTGVQFHPEKSGAAGAAVSRAMPLPRLIPCLDVAGGRVVKGVRFEGLRDVGDPVELGAAYSSAGADELVFLDVQATLEERASLVDLVRLVAEELSIPFTVGGGVRSVEDAAGLLEAGADKISVNSAALARPELVTELAERLGTQAVVIAIDVSAGEVRSHAGTRPVGRLAVDWAREAEARGAGEVLLTSIDADGTRDGYDLGVTRAVADAVSIPVIASGGAGEARHVAEALDIAQAALLASILHEDPARLETLRAELRELGVPLRDAA